MHELAPLAPSPKNLWLDLRACRAAYVLQRVPVGDQLGFLALRAVHRIAYWSGWQYADWARKPGDQAERDVVPESFGRDARRHWRSEIP